MRFNLVNATLSDCSDAVVFKVKIANMSSETLGLRLALHVHFDSWVKVIGDSTSVDISLDYADAPVESSPELLNSYCCHGVIYSNSGTTGSLGVSCGGLLAAFTMTKDSNRRGAPWQHYSEGDRVRIAVYPHVAEKKHFVEEACTVLQ